MPPGPLSPPAMPSVLRGVVSLLDRRSSERVMGIWETLDRELGLQGVFIMPFPHFSYHLALEYDADGVIAALETLARETPPFDVRARGLATFEGKWPVIHIALARDPRLRAFHRRLWHLCSPHARKESPYYRPNSWYPHISLAYGDVRNAVPLSRRSMREALEILAPGDYRWKIRIDNLTLVGDDGTVQEPVRTFPLRGRARRPGGERSPRRVRRPTRRSSRS